MNDDETGPRRDPHDEHRWSPDVGPYVLGALDPAGRAGFEAHLRTCASCRADVDAVAALPALLDQVPADLVAGLSADAGLAAVGARVIEEPPAVLLVDLLRVARQEERRRLRRRVVVGALAAAAVIVLAIVLPGTLPWGVDPAPEVSAQAITLSPVVDSPVTAEVSLEAVAWGTRIGLSCRYAEAGTGEPYAPPGQAAPGYALVLVSADGTAEEVATWLAVPGREVTVPAATLLRRDQIVQVELRDLDGTVLLSATV